MEIWVFLTLPPYFVGPDNYIDTIESLFQGLYISHASLYLGYFGFLIRSSAPAGITTLWEIGHQL
jgi:hypothetical protein